MGFASACQHKLHQQNKIPRCSRRSRCWNRWRLLTLQGYRARYSPAHRPRSPWRINGVMNAVKKRPKSNLLVVNQSNQ
ncbi:hypothetical protein CKAH01_13069 [Colletotrichum kahawae]|uniref:Uncharacterized protein n=1 Tax=Colletotrichum kahawae TaxID=34407 RepID=A0AAD9YRV7_COLKA|nr:hypothetical protein CKAH01_13069 [Colletotrichum kahawae]